MLDLWKDMRKISGMTPRQGVTTEQKRSLMLLARIKAIQCRVQPFVFERFTEYYKIYKKHE